MASASVKAIARIIAVWIFELASGFLPMAFADSEPILPIANAGAMVPTKIVAAVAMSLMLSKSMIMVVNLMTTFNLSAYCDKRHATWTMPLCFYAVVSPCCMFLVACLSVS